MNEKLKKQIQIDASTVYHVFKIIVLAVTTIVGVITFFPSRTEHSALASDHAAFKKETHAELENIRLANEKTIDLLCVMSVELIGKDAVVQYCTGRNR